MQTFLGHLYPPAYPLGPPPFLPNPSNRSNPTPPYALPTDARIHNLSMAEDTLSSPSANRFRSTVPKNLTPHLLCFQFLHRLKDL